MTIQEYVKVSFDLNGGIGDNLSDTYVIKNSSTSLPVLNDAQYTSPGDDGLIFGGWATDKSDSTTIITNTSSITTDCTLHAMWRYTITLNRNYGGTPASTTLTCYHGIAAQLPSTVDNLTTGVTLGGWSMTSNSLPDYGAGETSSNGLFHGLTITNGQSTLYAIYKITIEFKTNGETSGNLPSDMDIFLNNNGTIDSYNLPSPSNLTKNYCDLVGWSIASHKSNIIADYELGSQIAIDDLPTPTQGKIELYPTWKYSVYDVTITGYNIISIVYCNDNNKTDVTNDDNYVKINGIRTVRVSHDSGIILKPDNSGTEYVIKNIYAISDGYDSQDLNTTNNGIITVLAMNEGTHQASYTLSNFITNTIISITDNKAYTIDHVYVNKGGQITELSNNDAHIQVNYDKMIYEGETGIFMINKLTPCEITGFQIYDSSDITNGDFSNKTPKDISHNLGEGRYLIDYSEADYCSVVLISINTSVSNDLNIFISDVKAGNKVVVSVQAVNVELANGTKIAIHGTYYTDAVLNGKHVTVYGNISDLNVSERTLSSNLQPPFEFDLGDSNPYWIYATYENPDGDVYTSMGVLATKKVTLSFANNLTATTTVNGKETNGPVTFFVGSTVTITATKAGTNYTGWSVRYDGDLQFSTLTSSVGPNASYTFVISQNMTVKPY